MKILRGRGVPVLSRVCLMLVSCCLIACGSNAPAPVEDRTSQGQASSSSSYRVQGGDTLYSIAFRYGLDYRKVAAANSINSPYTIYPGQRIFLREKTASTTARAPAPKPKPAISATINKPQSKPVSSTASTKPVTSKNSSSDYAGKKVSAWRWPTSGRVTRGYSGSVHKGIDINGNRGDPVNAVAAGKVVYAGTGIIGFGELLIIKHNEVYLSAYGHNDRLLVSEGQTVTAGQEVAKKGSSGTDTVKLHFEIRREGKPIDPQRLLPKRQ